MILAMLLLSCYISCVYTGIGHHDEWSFAKQNEMLIFYVSNVISKHDNLFWLKAN